MKKSKNSFVLDENKNAVYSSRKDEQGKLQEVEYVLKGEKVIMPQNAEHLLEFALRAQDVKTKQVLGKCDFVINFDNTVYLVNIKIEDHRFDHLGIGTMLLYAAENTALDCGVSEMFLMNSPQKGYDDIVNNFYKKNGYTKNRKSKIKLQKHLEVGPFDFEICDLSYIKLKKSQKHDVRNNQNANILTKSR